MADNGESVNNTEDNPVENFNKKLKMYPKGYNGRQGFEEFFEYSFEYTARINVAVCRSELYKAYFHYNCSRGYQLASSVSIGQHLGWMGVESRLLSRMKKQKYYYVGLEWKNKTDRQTMEDEVRQKLEKKVKRRKAPKRAPNYQEPCKRAPNDQESRSPIKQAKKRLEKYKLVENKINEVVGVKDNTVEVKKKTRFTFMWDWNLQDIVGVEKANKTVGAEEM
ncbi:hypothetical protein Hamer_G002401 [Homarus americanus]|uniref:Uncharacterized protein n=1 Tax=Homarus americanus TaxID=6706 RepID=A0A8J5K885_HOMAM|nr:hypothetical protein Hamer_G002401 [Homarus americanus]